jgi:hypothetical protein
MANNDNQPPAKYVSFLSKIIKLAQQNLKNDSQLLPVAFLISHASKKTEILGSDFSNPEEKDFFAETVKQRANKMQADAICFLAESWTIPEKYQKPDMVQSILKKYGSVSNFPERKEIVLINLETNEGVWVGMSDLKPAKKGKKMVGIKWMKSPELQGRFANLLPVKYPTPKQIEEFIAKARVKFKVAGFDPDAIMEKRSIIQILESMIQKAPLNRLTDEMLNGFVQSMVDNKPEDM